jgi:hypothetical protein
MIHVISDTQDPLLQLVEEDPVRPHIAREQRVGRNAQVWVLQDSAGQAQSVVCVSFACTVPTSEQELFDVTCDNPMVATLYTIWSRTMGGGQALISQARDFLRINYPHITRLVTLSPPTALARRFHIKNGARELQVNADTVNFEYDLA